MVTLLVHAVATWLMAGVIWYTQIIHYPLLAQVGEAAFPSYQRANIRYTAWLVIPVMLVELATGLRLVFAGMPGIPPWQTWLGLGLLIILWASTVFWLGPMHTAL